jgi:hypothetical protein
MSSRYAAWAVVLLVLGHLCWLQLRTGSAAYGIWAAAASHRASNGTTKREAAAPQAALDGNVLLQLAGYAKTNPVVERSLFYFYFQTTYALYPRRLYAAPAGCIVNGSDSIMRAKFSPDQQWLKAHQVRYVATFGSGNIGGAPPPWEKLSWNSESTGGPTNQARGD